MWNKLGRLFNAEGQYEWMSSHATVPTPLHLRGDTYRVFFSTRDKLLRNQVGYVDIEVSETPKVLSVSKEPVLELGNTGYFDCDGIYATSIVAFDDEVRFYYAGWNAGVRGTFYSNIGVAVSKDGGNTFEKYTEAPILSRDAIDKWAVMAPFVLRLSPTNWVMWYTSGIKLFHDDSGKLKSYYDVKTALSNDGFNWKKTGESAIPLEDGTTNIARACVYQEDGIFKVYYPYVTSELGQYRIGYGESQDGMRFTRKDDSVQATSLAVANDQCAWDGLAVTYPHIFFHKGNKYMLYNGNGFGQTGFGLAVWR